MPRTRTENEYVGRLLEYPVFSALKYLKQDNLIKDFYPNCPKKYGGDWDAIVLLNDGSFLDIECMNFNTKYSYNENSARIGGLPNRLKGAIQFFGKVRKTVLVITNCLDTNHAWLDGKCIEPIFVGEQITEPLNGRRHTDFVSYLVGMLKGIIERIEKIWMKSSLLDSFVTKIHFVKTIERATDMILKSDAIKWCNPTHSFGIISNILKLAKQLFSSTPFIIAISSTRVFGVQLEFTSEA